MYVDGGARAEREPGRRGGGSKVRVYGSQDGGGRGRGGGLAASSPVPGGGRGRGERVLQQREYELGKCMPALWGGLREVVQGFRWGCASH
jgi:hypothetical protein